MTPETAHKSFPAGIMLAHKNSEKSGNKQEKSAGEGK